VDRIRKSFDEELLVNKERLTERVPVQAIARRRLFEDDPGKYQGQYANVEIGLLMNHQSSSRY